MMPTGGSGDAAGPLTTEPLVMLNLLPWHGQLIVPPDTVPTMHPAWVHTALKPWNSPDFGWVITIFLAARLPAPRVSPYRSGIRLDFNGRCTHRHPHVGAHAKTPGPCFSDRDSSRGFRSQTHTNPDSTSHQLCNCGTPFEQSRAGVAPKPHYSNSPKLHNSRTPPFHSIRRKPGHRSD